MGAQWQSTAATYRGSTRPRDSARAFAVAYDSTDYRDFFRNAYFDYQTVVNDGASGETIASEKSDFDELVVSHCNDQVLQQFNGQG